jgi:hypothetical protein
MSHSLLQIINKAAGVFEDEDEEIMGTFLDLAGPILAQSSLVATKARLGGGSEASGPQLSPRSAQRVAGMAGMAEGSDEED